MFGETWKINLGIATIVSNAFQLLQTKNTILDTLRNPIVFLRLPRYDLSYANWKHSCTGLASKEKLPFDHKQRKNGFSLLGENAGILPSRVVASESSGF